MDTLPELEGLLDRIEELNPARTSKWDLRRLGYRLRYLSDDGVADEFPTPVEEEARTLLLQRCEEAGFRLLTLEDSLALAAEVDEPNHRDDSE